MYGLVNKAIKDLVTDNHGDEAWQKVCEIAEFHEGDFISMSPYPDKLTFTLVGAVAQVLKADATDVLEAFGEYWILYTADQGYGNLMDLSGKTFVEFLGNLELYGPSTGRIGRPTGQSLCRHAPDQQHPGQVLQNFFRQTSVPWAALAYGGAGSWQKPAVSRLF